MILTKLPLENVVPAVYSDLSCWVPAAQVEVVGYCTDPTKGIYYLVDQSCNIQGGPG